MMGAVSAAGAGHAPAAAAGRNTNTAANGGPGESYGRKRRGAGRHSGEARKGLREWIYRQRGPPAARKQRAPWPRGEVAGKGVVRAVGGGVSEGGGGWKREGPALDALPHLLHEGLRRRLLVALLP